MGARKLIVAARASRLSRTQTGEAIDRIRHLFPETDFELLCMETPGDRDLATPLSAEGVPDDFFTRDLDDTVLNGQAALSVHSAKDLPAVLRPGLTVAALLPAADIRDALVLRRDLPAGQTPRIIGTSSPRRDAFIRKLYPEAEARPLRGTIDARIEALDKGEFDGVIIAACALDRLDLSARISQYLHYDPLPQQGRLALVVRDTETELLATLARADVRRTAGLVAIVGCPADRSLLSERARSYLNAADLVLHDRLVPDAVLLEIKDKARSVGKAGGEKSIPQSEIHRLTLEAAEQGKLVVRLKGGDPAVFGHLAEELEFLTSWNIRVDLVPAPTAAQVAAAKALAPLTHRGDGRTLTLVSGHAMDDEEQPLSGPDDGNLAVYMAVKNMSVLARRLNAVGWPDSASIVIGERLGYTDERYRAITLGQLPDEQVELPSVFLVGVKSFPSRGPTLFVGTDPEHFLKYGPLVHWPLIRLVTRPLEERVAALDSHLADVTGLIFPGRFAVRSFMEALLVHHDARALAGKRILAVGPATADELKHFGLHADRAAPSLAGIRALVKELSEADKGRYLYPCSDAAPQEERTTALAPYGLELVPEVFYRNRVMPFRELPRIDYRRVLFTSSSTVRAYFEGHPEEKAADRTWVAVGPSTLKTIEGLGLVGELLA